MNTEQHVRVEIVDKYGRIGNNPRGKQRRTSVRCATSEQVSRTKVFLEAWVAKCPEFKDYSVRVMEY
jgi:hypothetical protein